jgi:hypothetical protein
MEAKLGSILPVAIGIAVGILFILLLAAAVSLDLTPVRFGHANRPTDEDRALLMRLLEIAPQQESAKALRMKYPPADIGIYQYGETESKWSATIVYSGGSKVRVESTNMTAGSSLISYHSPTIWMTFDRDGNLEWMQLRCAVGYLDQIEHDYEIISTDAAVIRDYLISEKC